MLAITLGKHGRKVALVTVATLAVFGSTMALAAAGAGAATVRTCQGGGAGYTVTVPLTTGSRAGVDPEETYAANCTIGYHEKKGFPFSLVAVVLAFTAGTLILLHFKKDSLDLPGGAAFNVTGRDA
jgi:hypothetical protein